MGLLTRRAALRALGVAGVVGLGGCSRLPLGGGPNEQPPDSIGTDWVPPDDEWRLPAADLRNTARSSFAIEEQPVSAWHTAPSRGITERAVPVATRDVVISTRRHAEQTIIRAHDATDGTVRWRRQFQTDQLKVGGLVDGTLLVSDDHRIVVALAASDGTTQWRRDLYAHVAADVPERFLFGERFVHLTLLPTPEAVYVQTDYGVHGLAPTDGREQWRLYLGDLINDGSAGPLDRSPSGLALVDEVLWASYGGGRGNAPDRLHIRQRADCGQYDSAAT